MAIDEFDGIVRNQIYDATHTYLGKKMPPSTRKLKVSKPDAKKGFAITTECDEVIMDMFNGIKFNWVLICREVEYKNFHHPEDLSSTLRLEVQSLELSFHKKPKELVLTPYLPFILQEAKLIKQEVRALRIFMVGNTYRDLNEALQWLTNYLHFDIYDLELTKLLNNSECLRLLIAMENRSTVVAEDNDCTIKFHDRTAESRATC